MPASPPPPASPPAAPPAPPQTFDLTVEEFCRRISSEDPRVEMVAGFYADERATGKFKDSEAAFRARYAAFQIRPA